MTLSFRRGLAACALVAATALPLLAPSPAKAWWVRGGWRPAPVVVVRPGVRVAPVYVAPAYPRPYARVWVPAHINAWGRWVPGHWR